MEVMDSPHTAICAIHSYNLRVIAELEQRSGLPNTFKNRVKSR